jgi:hypothetical protein
VHAEYTTAADGKAVPVTGTTEVDAAVTWGVIDESSVTLPLRDPLWPRSPDKKSACNLCCVDRGHATLPSDWQFLTPTSFGRKLTVGAGTAPVLEDTKKRTGDK